MYLATSSVGSHATQGARSGVQKLRSRFPSLAVGTGRRGHSVFYRASLRQSRFSPLTRLD